MANSCAWPPTVGGNVSILFQELTRLGFPREQAKSLYAFLRSDEFKKAYSGAMDANEEPVLSDVLPKPVMDAIAQSKGALLSAEELSLASFLIKEQWVPSVSEPRTPEEERMHRQREIVRRTISNIEAQVDELKTVDADRAKKLKRDVEKEGAAMKKLYEQNLTDEAILSYTLFATQQIADMHRRFFYAVTHSETIPLEQFNQVKNLLAAYETVRDVRDAVDADPRLRDRFKDSALAALRDAAGKLDEMGSAYLVNARKNVAREWARADERTEAEWRSRFQRDIDQNLKAEAKRGVTFEPGEREERARQYVEKMMAESRTKIEQQKLERMEAELKEIDHDISGVSYWLDGIQHSGDQVFQIAQDIVQRKRDEVREGTIEKEGEVLPLYEALAREKSNPADPARLYEDILDGQHIAGKYKAEFLESRRAMYDEVRKLEESGESQKAEEVRRQWYRENIEQEFTDDFQEEWNYLFNEKSDAQREIAKQMRAIERDYTTVDGAPDYASMPASIAEEYKRLVKEHGKTAKDEFSKRLNDLGYDKLEDFVRFEPTGYYHETVAGKKAALTEEEYAAWHKANHQRVKRKVSGVWVTKEEPIRLWTERRAVNPSHYNPRYIEDEVTPTVKWLSGKYELIQRMPETSAAKQMWRYARQRMLDDDRMRPADARLTEKVGDDYFIRLPGVRKEFAERSASQGFLNAVKTKAVEGFTLQEGSREDAQEIGVAEKPGAKRRQRVPAYFSRPVDPKDQSYDLAGLLVTNHYVALNHKLMSEIAPEMEVVYSVLESREVREKKGLKNLFGKTSKEPIYLDHSKVRGPRRLRAYFDENLYGERVEGDNTKAEKILNTISSYVSTTLLAGNVVAGISNIVTGEVNILLEAIGGGVFSKGAWGRAHAKYMLDLPHVISDMGRREVSSRTNKLSILFDGMNNWRGPRIDFAANNLFRRNLRSDTLHAVNTMGEHFMQHVGMYALLGEIKAVNESGSYLDHEGKPTRDPSNAMSLEQALDLKDGEIKINPSVTHVRFQDGTTRAWNEDTIYRIRRMLRDVNEQMHGAYSDQNRTMLQRYLLGRMVLLMRKWIRPALRRRYSGLWRILQARDENGNNPLQYNYQSGRAEEGYHVTALRFILRLLKDSERTVYDVTGKWSDLTDYERGNIKKSAGEFVIAIVAILAAKSLEEMATDADDDDANLYWFGAYQTHRLFTELSFFWDPAQTLTILQHPSPVTTMMSNAAKLAYQAFGDLTEEYVQGRRKGQLKIQKRIEDFVPIYHQIDRVEHMDDVYTYFMRY